MFCKHCMNEMEQNAIFCDKCGKSIQERPDNVPPPPSHTPPLPYPPHAYHHVVMQEPADGLATASLVLGIIGLVMCGLFLSIPGLVCGIMAKKQGNKGGKATAGLILSIVATALWALGIIFYILIFALAFTL